MTEKRRPLKVTVEVAVAATLGLAAGGFYYFPSTPEPAATPTDRHGISPAATADTSPERVTAGRLPDARPVNVRPEKQGSLPLAARSVGEDNAVVYAAPGLNLRPERGPSGFVGYRVVGEVADSRFDDGDIIVSVNGQPVEDSAAGSEILIAALLDQSASIETRSDPDE